MLERSFSARLNRLSQAVGRFPARRWAALVFWLTLGLHAGYIWHVRQFPGYGIADYHLAQGTPFGDATLWNEIGLELGLGWGSHVWTARRPVYGWFLGMLYTMFPGQYGVALAANVLIAALIALFIFDILRRLFGTPVGVCGAALYAFSGQALVCTSVTLSEPLGMLLLVWHFWLLVRAVDERRLALVAASALLFALSNATRTLTLLALPGLTVCLVWLWARGDRRSEGQHESRRALLAGALFFGISASVVLAFMGWNYWRNGIFTLSDNTAGDLYAVAAPEFGFWTPEVMNRMLARGLWRTKEQYDWQMAEARRNIRANPELFARRIAGHMATSLTQFQAMFQSPLLWLFALVACAAPQGAANTGGLGARLALFVALAAAARWPWASSAAMLACVAWGLAGRPRAETRLLAVMFMFTLLAIGMFGSRMERLLLMFQWSLEGMLLGAIWQVCAAAAPSLPVPSPGATNKTQSPDAAEPPIVRLPARLWGAMGLAVLLLGAVVLYRNTLGLRLPPPGRPPLAAQSIVLEQLQRTSPSLFAAYELAHGGAENLLPLPCVESTRDDFHGRLLAEWGYVEPTPAYFPAWSFAPVANHAAFRERAYDRTVLRIMVPGPDGNWGPSDVVVPGDARALARRTIGIIGRVRSREVSPQYVEALAWYPADSPSDIPRPNEIRLLTFDPEHCRVLAALAGHDQPSTFSASPRPAATAASLDKRERQ